MSLTVMLIALFVIVYIRLDSAEDKRKREERKAKWQAEYSGGKRQRSKLPGTPPASGRPNGAKPTSQQEKAANPATAPKLPRVTRPEPDPAVMKAVAAFQAAAKQLDHDRNSAQVKPAPAPPPVTKPVTPNQAVPTQQAPTQTTQSVTPPQPQQPAPVPNQPAPSLRQAPSKPLVRAKQPKTDTPLVASDRETQLARSHKERMAVATQTHETALQKEAREKRKQLKPPSGGRLKSPGSRLK